MVTHRSGHKPGGGIASRNVRHVTAPKAEPKPYVKRPAGVSQLGYMVGDHPTTYSADCAIQLQSAWRN